MRLERPQPVLFGEVPRLVENGRIQIESVEPHAGREIADLPPDQRRGVRQLAWNAAGHAQHVERLVWVMLQPPDQKRREFVARGGISKADRPDRRQSEEARIEPPPDGATA